MPEPRADHRHRKQPEQKQEVIPDRKIFPVADLDGQSGQKQQHAEKPQHQGDADEVRNTDGRRFFARCIVSQGDDGRWYADLTGPQGSGILTSMSQANALTVIPEDLEAAQPGDEIAVMMLDWEHAP